MSHITRFSVEGLAGRKGTISLELNRDLSVFFGSNGSGKTSLLKILHSAMEDEAEILADVPFKKAEVEIFSVTYDKALVRNISQRTGKKPEPEGADARLVDRVKLWTVLGKEQNSWSTSPKPPKITAFGHRYLPISRLYSSLPTRTVRTAAGVYFEEGPSSFSEEVLDQRFAEFLKKLWATYSANISTTCSVRVMCPIPRLPPRAWTRSHCPIPLAAPHSGEDRQPSCGRTG